MKNYSLFLPFSLSLSHENIYEYSKNMTSDEG